MDMHVVVTADVHMKVIVNLNVNMKVVVGVDVKKALLGRSWGSKLGSQLL